MNKIVREVVGAPAWGFTQWVSRLWLDPLILVVIVGGHALLVARWPSTPTLLEGTAASTRPALYGASAIVLSLIGTLGSVSVAQYLQARGDRARELKRRHPGVLGRSWKVIFGSTLAGSILFLVAYRLDLPYMAPGAKPTTGTTAGEWVYEAGSLIALLALLRLVALFGQLVDLIVLDDTEPLSPELEINPDFFSDAPSHREQARAAG
jgi:hypothetical protein